MAVNFADVAQLNLSEPDPIDWSQYRDSQAAPEPVPDGIYDVQAPEEILFEPWTDGNTGKTYLRISGETRALTIVNHPEFSGRKLFYPFVSNRKYRNSMGSQMGDYLRSFGMNAQPTTHQEYAQLVSSTANRIAKVQTKQEGYCKACSATVFEGQSNAVPRCPNCSGPVSVRARIDRWISQVQR